MIKYKLIVIINFLFISIFAVAQECVLPVAIALDDDFSNIPIASATILEQSLKRIATENGLTTDAPTQFVITAHCDILEKSNHPGPPMQTVYNLGITFYFADAISQKKFGTAYITVDGVGTGEVKSYNNAFKHINSKNADISRLMKVGKSNMMRYYDSQYTTIIKEAKRLESMQNYEEALMQVMSIPVCSAGGETASAYALQLYTKNLNRVNLFLLNRARSLWAAGQDQETAFEVCEILAQIDSDSACYNEAAVLMGEVKKQVRSDIDFEMREKYHDAIALEKQRIETAKAVGVAFGKGQQPTTTNLMWLK